MYWMMCWWSLTIIMTWLLKTRTVQFLKKLTTNKEKMFWVFTSCDDELFMHTLLLCIIFYFVFRELGATLPTAEPQNSMFGETANHHHVLFHPPLMNHPTHDQHSQMRLGSSIPLIYFLLKICYIIILCVAFINT